MIIKKHKFYSLAKSFKLVGKKSKYSIMSITYSVYTLCDGHNNVTYFITQLLHES